MFPKRQLVIPIIMGTRQKDSGSTGTDDGLRDTDRDGLTHLDEVLIYHTNPTQYDTDGDGLNDGWELRYGMNPNLDNTGLGPDFDPLVDPDLDGLTNLQEEQLNTNPFQADTDGDGTTDKAEDQAGSNPTNGNSTPNNPGGTPGGPNEPPPPTVPVTITWGDPSGSHSEKYRIILETVEGDPENEHYRSNQHYGKLQTETFNLPKGARYKIKLTHQGTDPNWKEEPRPDYDYSISVDGSTNMDSDFSQIIQDDDGILGRHDESQTFFAEGKFAYLNLAWLTSKTEATTPADRRRKKLGVGEKLELKLKPSAWPNPHWDLNGTVGTTMLTLQSGGSADLEAGKRACQPNVEVSFQGPPLKLAFDVVEPNGERARISYAHTFAPRQQGVLMRLEITTLPEDVSFYNVKVIEIDKGTQNITGFFVGKPAESLKHHPADWIQLTESNQWWDDAGFYDWGSPTTWANGTYEWAIDVRWRVKDKETGDGVFLAKRTQTHLIQNNTGTSTETKLGNTTTNTPLP